MTDKGVDKIAAAVIQSENGKVLLLKRAAAHTTNPGKWCFVTGYVQDTENPETAAVRELREELGISAHPVRAGETVIVHTEWGRVLHVSPFLFLVNSSVELKLNKEHSEYVWIFPEQIYDYDIVQQLDEDLINLGLLKT